MTMYHNISGSMFYSKSTDLLRKSQEFWDLQTHFIMEKSKFEKSVGRFSPTPILLGLRSCFSHWLWVIQMVSKVHNYPSTLPQRSSSIKEPCAIRVHPTWVPTRLPVDPAVPEIENDLGTKEAAGDVGDVGVDGCVLSAQAAYWIPQKLRSILTQTL